MDQNEQSPTPAIQPDDNNSLEGSSSKIEESDVALAGTNTPPVTAPNPADNASTPTASTPSPKKPHRGLRERIRHIHFNAYLLVFAFVIVIAGVIVFIAIKDNNSSNQTPSINSQKLTESELKQLAASDVNVGNSNQVLNIASNTVIGGQLLVRKDLDVAGSLKVGDSLSLPNIKVSDVGNFGQVQASKVSVSGNTAVQGALTVNQSLTVNGSGNFGGSITANQLNVSSLQLNGDLVLNHHIQVGGATPSRSTGSALGSGGTASISGSDTAGTVNINTGGSPGAGCFITITFSQRFSSTPHVVITPVGSAAAGLSYYVDRSTTSFSVCTASTPPAGASFGFDYIAFD